VLLGVARLLEAKHAVEHRSENATTIRRPELTAFGRSLDPFLLGLRDRGDRYKRGLLRVQSVTA